MINEVIAYLRQQCHRELIYQWQKNATAALTRHKNGKDIWQFPAGSKDIYFHQVVTTDSHQTYLCLVWWASLAEIFINGELQQRGDLFDQKCRIPLLSNSTNQIEIYLSAPQHDRGGLITSELRIENDYCLTWEELSLMQTCAEYGKNSNLDQQWDNLVEWYRDDDKSLAQLQTIHSRLRQLARPLFKEKEVYLLGNSHIDIAWLWTIAETKAVLRSTFSSVLVLQQKFPEMIFNQSSAVTYEWIELAEPKLFAEIRKSVEMGTWELVGGQWVEPDCNLPCGESLIRQILYGKSYFLEKFNVDIKVAWLPDSFGFNWQLPQILIKSGFRYFVTQKLSWNDTTKFPYHIFYWRGVDGSQILSYFTNLIGDDINPITIIEHLEQLQKEHQLNHTLWLYGVGDHGGGPTADMLNIARCWQKSDLFPQIKHTRIVDYLELLEKTVAPEIIPTWHDELYLEFHRGTYTTKADQKRQNRSIELLLLNLEKIATIHSLLGQSSYPTDLFNRAWKLVLVNQFHDIITGTSIPEVFAEANQDWQTVREIGDRVLREIHSDPLTNSSDLVLSNLYGWDTQQLVEIDLNKYPQPPNSWLSANYQISEGKIYLIANVPAFSWIDINSLAVNTIKRSSNVLNLDENDHEFLLENQYLLVTISKLSGEITQIHDKRYNHNVLRQPIHWQFFDDRGQYWDAWNIDPEYEQKLLPAPIFVSTHLKIAGQLLIVVETVHQFHNSQITRQIQLNSIDPFLTVTNFIDWQEEYTLAKIAFPVNFSCNYATYEIPMAVIQRAVSDPVKWEVPAQFWADLSASTIGLSIINDCKYGYSAKADQISLTALRSPQWTCKDSDRGVHKFSYRLLPHAGCWRKAQTVKLAQEFNNPLFPMRCNSPSTDSLVRISAEQIVISAWKQSHDQNGWIFRCYEAHGEMVEVSITFNDRLRITKISECNLMEQGFLPATFDEQHSTLTCKFKPFEIKTFYLQQLA